MPPEDSFQIRCPRLGHQIHFSYCRQENITLPCPRILDCWHLYFDVQLYLRQELSPAEWSRTFSKPDKPKLEALAEILAAIQKKQGDT
jgi:hypothetical protein